MRGFTQTHYCADAKCPGFEGFEVKWAPDTMTDPAYPLDDLCPHCRSGILDQPVAYEDAIDGLLDELAAGGGIGFVDASEVNHRALLAAVQTELQRQARERHHSGACRTCKGRGEVLIGSHSVGGGCWNDQWDVCPACNGVSATQALSPATSKEAAAV